MLSIPVHLKDKLSLQDVTVTLVTSCGEMPGRTEPKSRRMSRSRGQSGETGASGSHLTPGHVIILASHSGTHPQPVPCIRNRLKWSNLIAEQDDKKSLGLGKCKVKRLELLHEYKIQFTIHIADVRWHLLTHFTVTPGPQDLRFVITVHSVLLGFTENLD